MALRQTTGSVVCPTCGRLVGVAEERCPFCGRWSPGMWGLGRHLQRLGGDQALVYLIGAACIAVYLLTLVTDPGGVDMRPSFGFLSPGIESLFRFGASGAVPVFGYGRWWSVLSASWLHGGLLHIVFNLMWVRQLAPATARLFGPGRMTLIYLLGGVGGFVLTSCLGLILPGVPVIGGARFTVGASAAVFGLLGALVAYGRVTGRSLIGKQAWSWALMLLLFGLLVPMVDNMAHAGGFLGGYAGALWLDPRRPERLEHLVAALVLLALSAASVLASFLAPLG